MASVTFSGVCKQYPDGTAAVDNLDLEINDGEFVVLVGPSGCGKTTSLRMAAGLEQITSGELRIGDEVANHLNPRQRDVAMVFQNYALYPHMTIYQNIAFPLQSQGVAKDQIAQRVNKAAALLGLEEHLGRRPKSLSGGQRQRVAMGRAIVRQPRVFLMDEPLSNLDAQLRVQMRAEIMRLQEQLDTTTLYVTHDQVEAMTMGDRIAVMRKGKLQQYGPPQTLYDHPENLFVAQFVGSPAMNLFRADVTVAGEQIDLKIGERTVSVPPKLRRECAALGGYHGRSVAFGIRPEDASERNGDTSPDSLVLSGVVKLVEALGHERLVHLEVPAEPVRTDATVEIAQDVDAGLASALEQSVAAHVASLTARFDGHSAVREGSTQEVRLDPDHVHLFDLESGVALR